MQTVLLYDVLNCLQDTKQSYSAVQNLNKLRSHAMHFFYTLRVIYIDLGTLEDSATHSIVLFFIRTLHLLEPYWRTLRVLVGRY